MATTKIIQRSDKINAAGLAPLYLRITADRISKQVSLKFKIEPRYWDENKQRIRSSYPNSARANAALKQKIAEVEKVVLELGEQKTRVRAKDIKDTLFGTDSPEFFSYAYEFINREYLKKEKISTYNQYKAILQKLSDFLNGKKLYFNDITTYFLRKYEAHLRNEKGNGVNTIHKNLKSIRRIINSAIEDDLLPYDKNPFLKFKLRQEKTEMVYLTEEELKRLEELRLTPGSKLELHRDMFVFSAYAGGLRVSDILQLKWAHFDGTHVSISTQKTSTAVSVKLPQKALKIIDKYKKGNPKADAFIFPVLKPNRDYSDKKVVHRTISSATAYANKDLRQLAAKAEIEKKISFHVARHTFATLALKKGVRIEYVSKLLGHASVKTTEIYAKVVNTELDKAMEVFDL